MNKVTLPCNNKYKYYSVNYHLALVNLSVTVIQNEIMTMSSADDLKPPEKYIYKWAGLHWYVNTTPIGNEYATALCPKNKCNCRLKNGISENSESLNIQEILSDYHFHCVNCNYKGTLKKSLEDKGADFLEVKNSQAFKDAKIIDIDGDLIRTQRFEHKEGEYWVDIKTSRDRKGDTKMMILAGSRNTQDKAQLFVYPTDEKVSFDHHDKHPSEIFSKVEITFKNSKTGIQTDKKISTNS